MKATLAIEKAMTVMSEAFDTVKSKQPPYFNKVSIEISEAINAMRKAMINASDFHRVLSDMSVAITAITRAIKIAHTPAPAYLITHARTCTCITTCIYAHARTYSYAHTRTSTYIHPDTGLNALTKNLQLILGLDAMGNEKTDGLLAMRKAMTEMSEAFNIVKLNQVSQTNVVLSEMSKAIVDMSEATINASAFASTCMLASASVSFDKVLIEMTEVMIVMTRVIINAYTLGSTDTYIDTPTYTDAHTQEHAQEHALEHTQEYALEHAQEYALEHALEHTQEHALEHTQEYALEHALEHTQEHTLEHASKHVLEHAPEHAQEHTATQASTKPTEYTTPNTSVLCLKKELEQANMKTLYYLRTEPANILKYFEEIWKSITEAFSEICEHNMLQSRDQNGLLKPEEKKRFKILSNTYSLNSKIIVLWLKNVFSSSELLDKMLKSKKLDEEVKEVEKYKLSAEEVEAVNLLGRV